MSSNTPKGETTGEARRKEEATSNETLSDIEETEVVTETGKSSSDEVPAPDAELEDRARGSDEAGPM